MVGSAGLLNQLTYVISVQIAYSPLVLEASPNGMATVLKTVGVILVQVRLFAASAMREKC